MLYTRRNIPFLRKKKFRLYWSFNIKRHIINYSTIFYPVQFHAHQIMCVSGITINLGLKQSQNVLNKKWYSLSFIKSFTPRDLFEQFQSIRMYKASYNQFEHFLVVADRNLNVIRFDTEGNTLCTDRTFSFLLR